MDDFPADLVPCTTFNMDTVEEPNKNVAENETPCSHNSAFETLDRHGEYNEAYSFSHGDSYYSPPDPQSSPPPLNRQNYPSPVAHHGPYYQTSTRAHRYPENTQGPSLDTSKLQDVPFAQIPGEVVLDDHASSPSTVSPNPDIPVTSGLFEDGDNTPLFTANHFLQLSYEGQEVVLTDDGELRWQYTHQGGTEAGPHHVDTLTKQPSVDIASKKGQGARRSKSSPKKGNSTTRNPFDTPHTSDENVQSQSPVAHFQWTNYTSNLATSEVNGGNMSAVLKDLVFIEVNTNLQFENQDILPKDVEEILFPCLEDDPTFPNSPEERQFCIRGMVSAFLNNTGTIEKPKNKIFKSRFADGATYYKPAQFENRARIILASTMKVHTIGFYYPIGDRDLRETILKTRNYTFAERWESMLKLFSLSKTSCVDALKGEKHWTIIGNAAGVLATAKHNAKSDDRRDNEIKEVRKLKKMAAEALEPGKPRKVSEKKGKKATVEDDARTQSSMAQVNRPETTGTSSSDTRKRARDQLAESSDAEDNSPRKRVRKAGGKHATNTTDKAPHTKRAPRKSKK